MNADEPKPMISGDAVSLEEKVKLALEENINLKSYIDRMNNECMELNAALFEEANKMVNDALAKQHYAAKQLKEKIQENEMLHSELRALKKLVGELSTNVVIQMTRNPFGSSRVKYDNISCDKSPEVYRKLAISNVLDSKRNSLRSNGLEQFNRRDLLTAMLTNHACKNHLDVDAYREFLEWIKNDCPLHLPNIVFVELNRKLPNKKKVMKNTEEAANGKEVTAVRRQSRQLSPLNNNNNNTTNNNNNDNNGNDMMEKHSGTPKLSSNSVVLNNATNIEDNHIDDSIDRSKRTPSPTQLLLSSSPPRCPIKIITVGKPQSIDRKNNDWEDSVANNNNNSTNNNLHSFKLPKGTAALPSSISLNHLNTPLANYHSNFLYRLYKQDIKPCFDFTSPQLLLSIYRALPELALEIVPITPELGGSLRRNINSHGNDNNNSSNNNNISKTTKICRENCVLLPKYEAEFHMKIRTSDSDELDCKISSQARDRIVSVVNLFQYLSIIKRGLASSPYLGRNRKSVSNTSDNVNDSTSTLNKTNDTNEAISKKSEMREQQFRTIQRHRLNITLARLGYGAPDLE
ncbi:unnamed protein product [Trichobilharzia szidati]|nr:unnamed protein product [Trichobilharzia szidati]